jgi:hypothetical protein
MTLDYRTGLEIKQAMDALDERLKRVESMSRRMRLANATLLRLQPGDVLAIRVPRPLASDEREAIARSFKELFASIGHADDIQAAIICGMDTVELDIIRPHPEILDPDGLHR